MAGKWFQDQVIPVMSILQRIRPQSLWYTINLGLKNGHRMTARYLQSQYSITYWPITHPPTMHFWPEFPEILDQNLITPSLTECLREFQNIALWDTIRHQFDWGILSNETPWFDIPKPLSEALARSTGLTDRSLSPGRSSRWGSGRISGSRWSGNRTLIARARRRAIKWWKTQQIIVSQGEAMWGNYG